MHFSKPSLGGRMICIVILISKIGFRLREKRERARERRISRCENYLRT